MTTTLRAARAYRWNRLPLRFEQLESRDCPSMTVFGADQGGGPLVVAYDTQASLTTPIKQFYAYDAGFRGGVRVALADISGDNVPDIITAAGPGGGPHVKVFDGVTNKVIRSFFAFDPSFTGGVYVAGGDVDDDGFGDIIVAAGAGGGPHVQVFSGATGKVIQSFFAYGASFSGGVRVGAGDVNNDGYADIITGAGPGGGPHVRVFDGKTGNGTSGFFAYPASFAGGVNVAAGDLDGDGQAEIITGPGLGGGPLARVWSGASAQKIREFNAFAPGQVGLPVSDPNTLWTSGLVVGVADVPGGGALDIATGPGAGRATVIRIFSSQDQAQLNETSLFAPAFMGGTSVGGISKPVFNGTSLQANFTANAVNEGSIGSVSFTNPSGGSGGYTYSFDLDNNGAFEITNSATSSATVLANLLNDGPGSRTLRGRIQDSTGAFTDYTTQVTINNVAPTVQLSGPFAGVAGSALNFAAAVTDPSPVDTAAGFNYNWTFGDGGTSTQKSPAYTYAKTGTYAVSLTVADKDNGTRTSTFNITISAVGAPPQGTFTGGTANEGNNTDVVFSNATGGTGKYTYSFDFDNNGTFEVSDSTVGLVSVPAQYFPDGPGSRVVRGRIKDSAGLFTDYTTTINIVNVPPTVQLGGPFVGLPNTSISFAATVTDPSPVDQAAGFTYSWNFGDGGTSTQKSPNYTFAKAGTYTVTLSATDKDNGVTTRTATAIVGTVTTSFITTPNDKIPNFGANPTRTAVASGNWSNPATWGGTMPGANDVVSIGFGVVVTYDAFSDVAVKTVAIQAGGSLRFRTDINTRLTVVNLLVMEGGELQIGTQAAPVAANVKAEVIFADVPLDLVADPEQYGNGLIALGKVTMHGAAMSDTFVRLAVEPLAGATTLTLAQPVTGWKAGDRLVLPDSRQLVHAELGDNFATQVERPTIAAISSNGLEISLTQPLQFAHVGARSVDGVLDFLPHVGNTSRNVVIRSQNASGTRGHTMYTMRADVDIRYSAFAGLGRTRIDLPDNTTFSSNGDVTHIGTNQLGRYSIHMHHLMGSAVSPANGYQFTLVGNSVFCPLTPMPFRWGITLHDAHYGLISDNVLFNWAGASPVTESGNESYNVIERNFAVGVSSGGGRADTRFFQGDIAFEGAAFWFRGFNNFVRDNVAASAGYGYTYFAMYIDSANIPPMPGADLSQYVPLNVYAAPILECARNEAYGAMGQGMTIWWLGSYGDNPVNGAGESIVSDFHVWHVCQHGYYGYQTHRLKFVGFVGRNNAAILSNGNEYSDGIWFGDYMTSDNTIENCDIQGFRRGIFAPSYARGTTTIRDSYLRNCENIYVPTVGAPGSNPYGPSMPGKNTVIDGVGFDQLPVWTGYGWTQRDIVMAYNNWFDCANFVATDTVYVYDFDLNANDDFQLYYTQQSPGFIVPQSGGNLAGAPAAGMTNQQTWSTYGLAIAGAVAPTTNERPNLLGYVRTI